MNSAKTKNEKQKATKKSEQKGAKSKNGDEDKLQTNKTDCMKGEHDSSVESDDDSKELYADCNKLVLPSHKALQCDGCGFWHHTSCANVSDEVYAFLSRHEDDHSIHWCCGKCTVMFRKLFGTVVKLEAAHGKLEKKIEKLEEKLDNMVDTWNKKSMNAMTVQDCVEGAMKVHIQEDKEEEAEKAKRKTSAIIHGLREPEATDDDDRIAEDAAQIAEMMDKISCADASIKKIIRLGKRPEEPDATPRPIKLVMETEADKEQILESAKNLRNIKEGGFARIFIHQDLTPKEREARKKLVEELKQRRANGEKDLILVNGKIVVRRTYRY